MIPPAAWRRRRSAAAALCAVGLMLAWSGLAASQTAPQAAAESAGAGGQPPPTEALPAVISLEPGEVHSLAVHGVNRVAIGNPGVVDLSIVSADELLLQAGAPGTTNLILWDQTGQHTINVEVVDRSQEALEGRLRQLVQQLDMPGVQVTREGDKIFLTGEVSTQEELDRLEQALAAYGGQVTNLVVVPPAPPPPPPPLPQSVKLTVQLIELSRSDEDKLGVDWMDKLTFTETAFGAAGPGGAGLTERLQEAFRVGALTRTGASAVVNLLVSEGKARILAEPKLVAASGKEATTTMGVEIPVITVTSVSSGTVSQNIEFKQTGVELSFKPTVLEDGHSIELALNAKVSIIDKTNAITVSGVVVPGFKIRQTETEIATESGQTVFITGLLQDEEKKNLSQLPGVGSIPVLGVLFRSTEFTTNQTELVIMVTPEITSEPAQAAEREQAVEQALTGAEVAASVEDPTLRYALQVQERIAQSLRYPPREGELGTGGRVTLRLHLFRDGTLGRAVVAESSGIEVLDSEALKVAESQAPYPPFPSDLIQQDLWLDVPVLFRP